jgi:hypothetical protein
MKKTFLLSLIWSFTVMSIPAQTVADHAGIRKEKTHFGIKAGGQIVTVRNFPGSGTRFPSLTAGVVLTIPFLEDDASKFFIAPELLYSQEGKDGLAKDRNFYNDYLVLPVMLKGYSEYKLFYIEIGPRVSYLIHQENEDTGYGEAEKWDVGLCVGGGINIGGNNKFELGLRINWGLTNTYPDAPKKNNNNNLALTLAYFF